MAEVWIDKRRTDYGEDRTAAAVVSELDDVSAAVNRVRREQFRSIVACDARRVWVLDDARDIAHWVALRLGISCWKARRWVACAWALDDYAEFEKAFLEGLLSTDKLVELTRLARAVDEPEHGLLSWALKVSVASIRERADWARKVAAEAIQEADKQRSLKWWWDDDHTYMNLYGSLPADMGIRVTAALERIASTLGESAVDSDDPELAMESRRADALDLLAGQAIAQDSDPDRATVVVHAPLSALTKGDVNGTSSRGEVVPPEVLQCLTCDSRLQMVLLGDGGAVVGIGMTSRLIPRWLRRAIARRDGFRCTFPNCGSRLGLDVHHVVPWPHGPTDPDNLTLMCRIHHRVVHKHGWHVVLAADQTTRWLRPDWTPYVPRPPSAVPDESRDPAGGRSEDQLHLGDAGDTFSYEDAATPAWERRLLGPLPAGAF